MIHTTATQTTTGIRFDGTGMVQLVMQSLKDYTIGFDNENDDFRFVFKYLNDEYWMGVNIEKGDNIRLQFYEERPSGGQVFVTKEVDNVTGEWAFTVKNGIVRIEKGGQSLIEMPYLNLTDCGIALYAENGTEFDAIWIEKEEPTIGTLDGTGEDRTEDIGHILYDGRTLKGSLDITGDHVFSIEYSGTGSFRLGDTSKVLSGEGKESLVESCVGITEWEVSSEVGSSLHIKGVQIEEGAKTNPILSLGETGEKSEVLYPVNDRVRTEGTLLMEYEGEGHLFTCGNMNIKEIDGVITATIGSTSVSVNGTGRFVMSWGETLRLVSEEEDEQTMDTGMAPGEEILFTGMPKNVEAIDNVVIWSKAFSLQEMNEMTISSKEVDKLFEASFEEELSTKEKTFVEPTMAPIDGSPILVRDKEGPLRGVSFFDVQTGRYRIWNEERFLYDGESEKFLLAYEDLDERFTVELRHNGETLGTGTIEPPFVRFILSEEEKEQLHGEEVTVRYQLQRSYYVDYDDAAYDSYRVYLARNKGVPVTVSHEGNRFSTRRLVKEVELNPLESTRSEGFMFLDDKVGNITSFRVFLQPDRLRADGVATSEIIIQPIDKNGTEVIGAQLMVQVEQGGIRPIISRESVRMRNSEGSYQYRYHAPYIKTESEGDNVLTHLLIKDLETGIGARIPIHLRPVKEDRRGMDIQTVTFAQNLFTYLCYAFQRKDMPELSAVLDVNEDGLVDEAELEWLRENMSTTEVETRVKLIEEMKNNGMINY